MLAPGKASERCGKSQADALLVESRTLLEAGLAVLCGCGSKMGASSGTLGKWKQRTKTCGPLVN